MKESAWATGILAALVASPVEIGVKRSVIAAVEGSGSCCAALKTRLDSSLVSYPQTTTYNSSRLKYHTAQNSELVPACIVHPTTAEEVSNTILTLLVGGMKYGEDDPGCKFAVKSGGHMYWAGASNVEGGVTIDLEAMNRVIIKGVREGDGEVEGVGGNIKDMDFIGTVEVGPGAVWKNVYDVLTAQGLGTSGGRIADVGVGGLTVGGGLSFFSPRYGFVCDNVVDFELVTSSGVIINANTTHHIPLLYALRGGSTNFGIVTRITLRTFPLGNFWGGTGIIPVTASQEQIAALHNLVAQGGDDPHTAVLSSWAYANFIPGLEDWFISSSLYYTKHENAVAWPKAFQDFEKVPRIEQQSTYRIDNISSFAEELSRGSENGVRQHAISGSFVNNREMMHRAVDLAMGALDPIKLVEGLLLSLTLQPITRAVLSKSRKVAGVGGNALGLTDSEDVSEDQDLINYLLIIRHNDAIDEELALHQTKVFYKRMVEETKKLGVWHRYEYLNYVGGWQDPMGSYGEESLNRLRAVSAEYDPFEMFQKQRVGGFKIPPPDQVKLREKEAVLHNEL